MVDNTTARHPLTMTTRTPTHGWSSTVHQLVQATGHSHVPFNLFLHASSELPKPFSANLPIDLSVDHTNGPPLGPKFL